MPAPAKSAVNMDLLTYEVLWNAESIGWVEDVDPTKIQWVEVEQKIGELGGIVVDQRFMGLQGVLSTMLHEVSKERQRQLMPWAASTGTILGTPSAQGYSKYAASKILRFHPKGISDDSLDLVFPKAFPNLKLPSSGGSKFRSMGCDWNSYPDQSTLVAGTMTYFYIGAAPT